MHHVPAAVLVLATAMLALTPPSAPPAPAAAPAPVAAPASPATDGNAPAAAPAGDTGTGAPSAVEPIKGSDLDKALRSLATASVRYAADVGDMVVAFPSYAMSSARPEGKLSILGSDTMGPMLSSVGIAYQRIHPKASISVSQGGSAVGLAALEAGTCDLAAVARDVTAEERARIAKATKKQVFVVPVAQGAACVYINADNPLRCITRKQCNGLFSMTHSMTPVPILRWNELDPASPLGNTLPYLYVNSANSGTLQVFTDWCMPGEELTTIGMYMEHGPSSVVNACCAYREVIGISGYANRQPRARALPIDMEDGKPPVEPSVANIRSGAYPMSRPLNMVFLAPDAKQIPVNIREFLRFLLSEAGQDTIAAVGNIPAEPTNLPEFLGKPVNGIWK
jgi:phosphate transport system substrate-binding protein